MRGLDSAGGIPTAPDGPVSPLLSIVIPVRNLGAYISSCLDTITGQDFGDIEIIAVDGCSKDNTRDLLEKRKLDEPRLTLLAADKPGPGHARNLGADEAHGAYLWFVDGDDELAPGALSAVAARLRSEQPDVLVVNHDDLDAGRLTTGQDNDVLARDTGASGPLADRPWLLDVRMVSWNKVVRREFYRASGARFLDEWPHEDVPVSCRLLLSADRISVLRQVCYHFRRERPGSATKSGERRRHFAVFGAWQQVLADARRELQAGDPGLPATVYHRLFQQAVWHCSTILDARPATGGRYIADGDRREFFKRMADLYASCKPRGYRRPGGFRGIKFRLIARRQYRLYELLDPLNTFRVRAARVVRPR